MIEKEQTIKWKWSYTYQKICQKNHKKELNLQDYTKKNLKKVLHKFKKGLKCKCNQERVIKQKTPNLIFLEEGVSACISFYDKFPACLC